MAKRRASLNRAPDARKRAAILQAARRLFLRHGFAQTSMDSIAKEAVVTKQTVYAHFDNKDNLFRQILIELVQKHAPPKRALGGKDAPVEKVLSDTGLSLLNLISSKDGIAATQLVIAEAYRHQELAQHYYESGSRAITIALADYLELQNRAGKLRISHPMSAASYFSALLKGNYYLRILLNSKPRPSPREKQSHVRECVAIFMRIYGGKNPLKTSNAL